MKLKKIFIFIAITVAILSGSLLKPGSAKAFNPNNIMDDQVFENSTSMSAVQIDIFLNGFTYSCISQNNGFSTDDPQGFNAALGRYTYGSKVSAGQAIFDVAQIYHVNPQVILATLQKEQSIVTGGKGCHYDRPNPSDPSQLYTCNIGGSSVTCTDACPTSYGGGCMNIAMSYNCPGACKASSEGFSTQLTLGTWILRFAEQRAYGNLTRYVGYELGDETYTYYGIMTAGWRKTSSSSSAINYDGSGTLLDGSSVTVANGATSSFYNFTPFQSGNISFINTFQGWFGSPYQVYSWSIINQYAYTDITKSTPVNLGNLGPNQRYYIGFSLKNTGNVTWSRDGPNPMNLGTATARDRASPFCDSSWPNPLPACNRTAPLHEWSVAPGQIGSFEFYITTPATTGSYNETYAPVIEGTAWMDNHTVGFPMIVNPTSYSGSTVSQAVYTDSDKRIPVNSANLVAGQHYYYTVRIMNNGNSLWQKNSTNPVVLGTSNPTDRPSGMCEPTWLGCNRPAALHEYTVAPGQIGSFEFWIKIPPSGTYTENFTPLLEGLTWMNSPPTTLTGYIGPAYYLWDLINQFAYTDSTKATPVNMGQLTAGSRYYIGFSLKNTGNTVWHQGTTNPFGLGPATTSQADLTGKYCDSTWPGGSPSCKRAAYLHEYTVAPGQIGSFEFWITAPVTPGSYNETYAPLMEGLTWMNYRTVSFPSIVH
jgi:hypothetical protein